MLNIWRKLHRHSRNEISTKSFLFIVYFALEQLLLNSHKRNTLIFKYLMVAIMQQASTKIKLYCSSEGNKFARVDVFGKNVIEKLWRKALHKKSNKQVESEECKCCFVAQFVVVFTLSERIFFTSIVVRHFAKWCACWKRIFRCLKIRKSARKWIIKRINLVDLFIAFLNRFNALNDFLLIQALTTRWLIVLRYFSNELNSNESSVFVCVINWDWSCAFLWVFFVFIGNEHREAWKL